jgi:broad specificity phosphatase PhoE
MHPNPLLIAVRHGETDYNARDCLLGHLDPPLNETGIKQAHRTAERLRAYEFTKIYASPLARARQTAEIIARGTFPITTDDRLKEASFGVLDGMPIAEAVQAGHYGEREQNRMEYKPEGGESYRELLARVEDFFTGRGIMNGPGPVLIVSHQGTTRMIAAYLGAMAAKDAAYRKLGHEALLIAERTADGGITAHIED